MHTVLMYSAQYLNLKHPKNKQGCPERAAFKLLWTSAAAAVVANKEKDNKCNDDYPGAVVIKKITKTVVVHKVSPFEKVFHPLATIL